MKCHICGERQATIHYIEIVEGKKNSQWVCGPCAEREGITPSEISQMAHGGLESFLGGMLTISPVSPSRKKAITDPVCGNCGFPFSRLQKKGVLGCPACYSAFRGQMAPLLRRYHGAVQHLGKVPATASPRKSIRREITRCKLLLEQAVALEDYEEAARLRDEVKKKELQIESLPSLAPTDPPDPPDSGPAGDPDPEPEG